MFAVHLIASYCYSPLSVTTCYCQAQSHLIQFQLRLLDWDSIHCGTEKGGTVKTWIKDQEQTIYIWYPLCPLLAIQRAVPWLAMNDSVACLGTNTGQYNGDKWGENITVRQWR